MVPWRIQCLASVDDCIDASLSYPLLATSGNALTTPSTSALNGIERNLASPISSGTIYVSCLLTPQGTLGSGNGTGFFGLYLHGSTNDLFMGAGGLEPYNINLRGGTDVHLSSIPEVVGQPCAARVESATTANW